MTQHIAFLHNAKSSYNYAYTLTVYKVVYSSDTRTLPFCCQLGQCNGNGRLFDSTDIVKHRKRHKLEVYE